MKLHDAKMAPNPRRVRIFLAEKGIAVETVQRDVLNKELRTPEFTALNPMQRLPVLELDDGTCISETVAICRYFEEMQPEPPLMGTDARDRALVEMWNRRMEHHLLHAVTMIFRHTHAAMAGIEEPQIAAWGEANRPKLDALLTQLDGWLAERPFIAGERLTIADITALCAIDFAKVIGKRLDDTTPNVKRWHGEMAARPSYKA